MEEKRIYLHRIGFTVLVILAVLTIGEFFIGSIAWQWWAILLSIACLKAFYIVRDYMHIGRLFQSSEEQGE